MLRVLSLEEGSTGVFKLWKIIKFYSFLLDSYLPLPPMRVHSLTLQPGLPSRGLFSLYQETIYSLIPSCFQDPPQGTHNSSSDRLLVTVSSETYKSSLGPTPRASEIRVPHTSSHLELL